MLSLLQVVVATLFSQGVWFGVLLGIYMLLGFSAMTLLMIYRQWKLFAKGGEAGESVETASQRASPLRRTSRPSPLAAGGQSAGVHQSAGRQQPRGRRPRSVRTLGANGAAHDGAVAGVVLRRSALRASQLARPAGEAATAWSASPTRSSSASWARSSRAAKRSCRCGSSWIRQRPAPSRSTATSICKARS